MRNFMFQSLLRLLMIISNFSKICSKDLKVPFSWNKYRSDITTQTKNNSLDYLVDPKFRNINRLFELSFKNGDNDSTRNSSDKYYMPLVEIKYFNALVDNNLFFNQPVRKKKEAYETLIEMSKNEDYTAGNLLDFSYHQNYYKLIGIDLLGQTDSNIPQQINFAGKLEEVDGTTMFYIAEKQQKGNSKFLFRFINCYRII